MNGWNLRLLLRMTLNEHEDRNYLGMSAIGKCARFLYNELVHGRQAPSEKSKRYFHEGYLHERDIVERIGEMGVEVRNAQRELVAPFDDRFRGHIDGEVEGVLLEVKSVDDGRFCRVMETGKPFEEHVAQVQMYLRYGGYELAQLVYKCRNTGEILVKEIERDERHGLELENKARMILAAVDKGEPPGCTCGYHKGGCVMWGLLELLWQAGKDQATILTMQAGNAEREGDAAKAATLQEAAEMLDAQADQHAATIEYIEGGGV